MPARILDRYLLGAFWKTFAGVMVACAVMMLLAEILDEFQDILQNQCPWRIAVLYFILILPLRLVQVLPLASMLAVLFSVGMLAHKREVLAITAAGLSPARIAAPMILSGGLIVIVSLLVAEVVVPPAETRANFYRKTYIQGKLDRIRHADVFARGERRGDNRLFYIMREFDNRRHVMQFPSIYEVSLDTGQTVSQLTASRGVLEEQSVGEEGRTLWRFEDAVRYRYDESGRLIERTVEPEAVRLELEANLQSYLATERKPEEMSVTELRSYIATLERHGEPADRYRTDMWLKIIFPFASVIFIVAGFSFAMRGQIGQLIVGFTAGILFAVVFYAVIAFSQALGHRDILPPILTILTPTLLFAALSAWLMRRSAFTMT